MEMFELARTGLPLDGCAYAKPCYRIPALATTGSGRLVAAWDVRADWRDLPGPFDVVYRTSDDRGRTWSDVRFLRHHEGNGGFGDASLTYHAPSGKLLCWYVGSTGRSFFSAEAGPQGEGLTLWLASSSDDGETWTHREFTGALKPSDVMGMFAASGNGIMLTASPYAGRLVQPFVLRVGEQHYAAMAMSDDAGETWTLGERVGPDCDENKIIELADGSVLMQARAKPRRRQAISVDGGVSFSEPQAHDSLVDPACNGGLARTEGVLVCSLLDDPNERRRLGLRLSVDEGATWSESILAYNGAAAYSVLATLDDGSLGMIIETGSDYDSLLFCRIRPSELGISRVPGKLCEPTLVARIGDQKAARPPEVAP